MTERNITCPRCGMVSYNGNDINEGYCGNCHDWTHGEVRGTRKPGETWIVSTSLELHKPGD